MLTRWLLRLLVLLTMVLTATIGLIRAQPYDDAELREFLLPPDSCPAPCWQGIRPGVTTVDEALAYLDTHSWVETIRVRVYPQIDAVAVTWTWNGQQPAYLGNSAALTGSNNLVREIGFRTTLTWGELLELYGQADWVALVDWYAGTQTYSFGYVDDSLTIQVDVHNACATEVDDYLQAPTWVSLQDATPPEQAYVRDTSVKRLAMICQTDSD